MFEIVVDVVYVLLVCLVWQIIGCFVIDDEVFVEVGIDDLD